jgi:acyl carrier protein
MGLETVEIIMKVEDHFGINVGDEVASRCVTVADLQAVIVNLLAAKGRPRSPELKAEVYADLVKIIAEQTSMKASDIRPDSKWVGDITDFG